MASNNKDTQYTRALNAKGQSILIDENGKEVKPTAKEYLTNKYNALKDKVNYYSNPDNLFVQKGRQDAVMNTIAAVLPVGGLPAKSAGSAGKAIASNVVTKTPVNIPSIPVKTQTVYHGGSTPIKQFDNNMINSNLKTNANGWGGNFTPSKLDAGAYADIATYGTKDIGNIATAKIPSNEYLLNLAETYANQSPLVKLQLQKINNPYIQNFINNNATGAQAYKQLVDEMGVREASNLLNNAGVLGNFNPAYNSGVSQGAKVNVIFNPQKNAQIIKNEKNYAAIENYLKDIESMKYFE